MLCSSNIPNVAMFSPRPLDIQFLMKFPSSLLFTQTCSNGPKNNNGAYALHVNDGIYIFTIKTTSEQWVGTPWCGHFHRSVTQPYRQRYRWPTHAPVCLFIAIEEKDPEGGEWAEEVRLWLGLWDIEMCSISLSGVSDDQLRMQDHPDFQSLQVAWETRDDSVRTTERDCSAEASKPQSGWQLFHCSFTGTTGIISSSLPSVCSGFPHSLF